MLSIFAKYGKYGAASSAPFQRISFLDAMETYGSDKPGSAHPSEAPGRHGGSGRLRLRPFEGQTVKAVCVPGFAATRKQIDKLCADVEVQSGQKAYWFRFDENGDIVGGIASFSRSARARWWRPGPQVKRFVGLTAGKKLTAQKTAGVLISSWPPCAPTISIRERYEFCWIVDFPMYEIGEESGELEFCHNPFSMPNGGAEILKKPRRARWTPSASPRSSTIWSATAWSSPPARCATMTPRL